MDFLENLFVINNLADIAILKFGLFSALVVTLPFVSLLLGSTLFSLTNLSNEDNSYAKFLSEIVTKKMWFRILFGVLPFFGAVFFYIQLYASEISSASGSLLSAFVFFVVGLRFSVLFKSNLKSNNRGSIFGWLGFVFTLASAFILVGYVQHLSSSFLSNSDSLVDILFSINSILYFILFMSLSFSITSAVVLGKLNRTISVEGYTKYWREYVLKTGMIFNFIQPLLLVLITISTDSSALSFSFFATIVLALLLMLITSIQFYNEYRNENSTSTSIVLVFLLLFSVLIFSGQISSENSQRKNSVKSGEQIEIFSLNNSTCNSQYLV